MNRIISEETVKEVIEMIRFPESLNTDDFIKLKKAMETLPIATALDVSMVDIHSKQTCPVEDFVYVSDLSTIPQTDRPVVSDNNAKNELSK